MHRSFILLVTFLFLINSPSANKPAFAADGAIEFSITVSGTILLGVSYRLYIDNDSSVRMGSYVGVQGKPYGFHASFIQNLSHSEHWPPYVGLGGDLMLAKDKQKYRMLYFVRGVAGLTYQPNNTSAWNSELWIAFFPHKLKVAPIGLSFGYLNTFD